MRIGIHPALKRHDGGIYQYSVTVLRALRALSDSTDHEFVVFAHQPDDPVLGALDHPAWAIRSFRPPWGPKSRIDLNAECDLDAPLEQPDMREWLLECGVDLMLYPSPHRLSFESGIPFVLAVHDIQHRLQPEFPEVSAEGERERREYVYRNAARGAIRLISNSETGRSELLECYGGFGLSSDRVAILPYAPPVIDTGQSIRFAARVRERYPLPDRFLFYPAQFWPHKNHLGLIEALGLLRERHGLEIPLVLTGSASGAVREQHVVHLRERAMELGVSDQIAFLGYVDDEDLLGLYACAEALVMPTFFGPTNIPVLEAWAMDCPVITSRVPGNDEQIGDAGVLVDPRNFEDIAEGIRRLWMQPALRKSIVAKGRERRAAYTAADFGRKLMSILDEAQAELSSGRTATGQVSCR
jgi:glycosyltransferase involved in cell wall biosynthesis